MNKDAQQVAIVTGASRGIGAALAQRVVATLHACGHKAIAVKADVADPDEVRALFDTAERELGKVDVLVNNAGVLKTMPLADTSDELFAQTFKVNVQGTFNTLREAARRLNDGGRIVSFLVSGESGWINGQVLRANGGTA